MENRRFIDFIASLAPEGETALVVRQKPRRDGSYTWPAFLPDVRLKDGEAWYANTGSFIVDRFRDGQPSASASCCTHVLFLILDDVGTSKVTRAAPLPPTWRIETSPGSEQWGYVFSEQPTTGEYTAAIQAIAAAGYSDPGACNAVRNVRVPGSINLKEGRDRFAARLLEFEPAREYTLAEIVTALGVTPGEEAGASVAPVTLPGSDSGPVVEWLAAQGLLLSRVNGAGWCDVTCPNAAHHTGGGSAARFHPSDNGFACLHAHCQHLTSEVYLDWIADQGGPQVAAGLRTDLLSARLQASLGKLDPAPNPIVVASERKEKQRLERAGWFARYAYVESDDAYFDLETRRILSRSAFNAIYRHVACKSVKTDRPCEASIWYDQNRLEMGGQTLAGLTYAAGDSPVVLHNGEPKGNLWIDGRPSLAGVAAGDVSLWLDLATHLIPIAREREHVLDVMAFKVQNARVKINHAILHMGDEGTGKDTLWAPFLWAVCGPDARNRAIVQGGDLSSAWGYAYESEVLILNELHEPEAAQRRFLANRLKPLIAAPPDTISVNRKMLHPYDAANRLFVLAFSNEAVPISISSQDRRWFVVRSAAGRLDEPRARRIWDWYRAGGFATCARWLADRDVSRFNPAAIPFVTEEKESLISGGMTAAEDYLLGMIERRQGEFARGVVGAPWSGVIDRAQAMAPPSLKLYKTALFHALKEAKWVFVGRLHSAEHATKADVWAHPDVARAHSKSELRRLIEPAKLEGSNVISLRRE